jgi:hypothetical protein
MSEEYTTMEVIRHCTERTGGARRANVKYVICPD